MWDKVIRIAVRECRRMMNEPVYLSALIIPSLCGYLLFTSLMRAGLPTRLPAGMVDLDDSPMSRHIERSLNAYQHTDIVAHYPTVHQAFEAMQRGEIYGFYLIPEGLETQTLTMKQPTVSFYLNYAYPIAGSLLYKDMRTLSELSDAEIGIKELYAKGAESWQLPPIVQPIATDIHPLHNPWLNYSVYLNNTLLPGVLMLMIFLITPYSIGTELKRGTARQWIGMANGNILTAIVGKLLPQTLLFLSMALLFNGLLYGYLHFPLNGGLWPMLAASSLLVISSQAFGVFLFCLFPWMRMAMSVASLWGVVSFSISGFTFPAMAMSPALQMLNNLFPLRHYFLIYAHSALNGYPIGEVASSYVALCLFAVLPLPFLGRLKWTLLTYKYIE